ncbi:MAG: UDP-glucose/GDP-mannose dehydrogenase family protein [Pseudomonadota bacterium]
MLKVCIIGTGYVGLVTGTCFAEIGHDVVCVDTDPEKIARLKRGEIPIYEPGLSELVLKNVAEGRLAFSVDISEVAGRANDFYFLAVGTPMRDEDGAADMTYVYRATEDAAIAIQQADEEGLQFPVFVTKSTVPVGTSQVIAELVGKHLPEERFAVASNPEFLREGNAVRDFMEPDRIVVGSRSERARALLEELYRPLTRSGRPLVVTSTVETAELIKYAANAFLATKVTFINELSRLCEKVGANVQELALGIGLDPRIGNQFLNAGPGYGGSCFPKDTRALVKTANDNDSPIEIVEAVVRANERHKNAMVEKIRTTLGGSLARKRIAILGLAFKANTDDMRDAPALTIIPALKAYGADVVAFDPIAEDQARRFLPEISYANSVEDLVTDADAVVILTEWNEFRGLNWPALLEKMVSPVVIDLRNLYSDTQARSMGMVYIALGRPRAV